MNIVNNDDPEDANVSFDVFMQEMFWQDMDDSANGIIPASNTAEVKTKVFESHCPSLIHYYNVMHYVGLDSNAR